MSHQPSNSSKDLTSDAAFLQVLHKEGQAILEAVRAYETQIFTIQPALNLLSETLKSNGRIILTGVGKSGKIAEKISSTLRSVGALSSYLHPTEALHGDLGGVRAPDLIWALSHSGKSPEVLALLPHLKRRQIKWIAQTQTADAPLCQGAAAQILTGFLREADPFERVPSTSTTVSLALGDAVAIALLVAKGADLHAFQANHPGGSLGDRLEKRLSLRVGDLMQPLHKVSQLSPSSSLQEIALSLQQSRLGGVFVTEESQGNPILLGLITDGDLRRALAEGPSCFSKTARDIATTQPVTSLADDLAWDALQRMENRPSRLSVLPVVRELQPTTLTPVGLIRLHDILQEL